MRGLYYYVRYGLKNKHNLTHDFFVVIRTVSCCEFDFDIMITDNILRLFLKEATLSGSGLEYFACALKHQPASSVICVVLRLSSPHPTRERFFLCSAHVSDKRQYRDIGIKVARAHFLAGKTNLRCGRVAQSHFLTSHPTKEST